MRQGCLNCIYIYCLRHLSGLQVPKTNGLLLIKIHFLFWLYIFGYVAQIAQSPVLFVYLHNVHTCFYFLLFPFYHCLRLETATVGKTTICHHNFYLVGQSVVKKATSNSLQGVFLMLLKVSVGSPSLRQDCYQSYANTMLTQDTTMYIYKIDCGDTIGIHSSMQSSCHGFTMPLVV